MRRVKKRGNELSIIRTKCKRMMMKRKNPRLIGL